MSEKKRSASYYHFGILLIAQDAWSPRDREVVLKRLSQRDLAAGGTGVFFTSFPTQCDICNQAREIFEELQGKNIGHSLIGGHDGDVFAQPGILELTRFFFDPEIVPLVKKMYFFEGGAVDMVGRAGSRKSAAPIIMRDRLQSLKVTGTEFSRRLEAGEYKEEHLYEITRDHMSFNREFHEAGNDKYD